MWSFPAALEQITHAGVKLRIVVQVLPSELAGLKDRDKLSVQGQHWIGAKIRSDLLGLALQDRRAQGKQRMIVL